LINETSQELFELDLHDDIMSASIGKKEHPGRLRGYSIYSIASTVYGKRRMKSPHFNYVSQETLNEMVKKAFDKALTKHREQLIMKFTEQLKLHFINAQKEMIVVPSIIPPHESPRFST
jgi:hypothetical protein